ncbi:MAG TPA: tetratricopeptide repeat protein [Terracidiphilus sp.]
MGLSRNFCITASLLLAAMASSSFVPAQAPAQISRPAFLDPSPSSSTLSLDPTGFARANTVAPTPAERTTPIRLSAEAVGDIAAAHRHFRDAIADYASAPQMTAVLWDKTGVAYEMLHDFGNAVRCYRQALKLNPGFAEVYNNLGTLYGLVQSFGKADKNYRMALKLDPDSPRFLMNLGTNLLAQHKFAEGWDAYRRALALDPAILGDSGGPTVGNAASVENRGAMYYYIALGCTRTGDVKCAVENLRAAIDRGFTGAKEIAGDQRFIGLRQNRAFQQLLAEENSR